MERVKIENDTGKKTRGRKCRDSTEKYLDMNVDKKRKEPTSNLTDPDSRILKTRKCFIQGYNGQISVDTDTKIILAATLTQDQNDIHQLTPMIEETIKNTDRIPKHPVLDAGYDDEK